MRSKRKSKARKAQQKKEQALDPVVEASVESFPPSDAPAWTSSGDHRSYLKRAKKGH